MTGSSRFLHQKPHTLVLRLRQHKLRKIPLVAFVGNVPPGRRTSRCAYIFKSGGFAVQIGEDNPFGKIAVDQACEETVNKDMQTSGGTKGFSLKPNAVNKYYLVAEYRSIFMRNLKDTLNLSKSSCQHNDLQKSRIARDEADVQSLLLTLEGWVNPFQSLGQDLICLSTGKMATADVSCDLLQANDLGERAYRSFSKERLEVNPLKVRFHDTMSKAKLKTLRRKWSSEKEPPKRLFLRPTVHCSHR